jgi:hypothetical protein
MAYPTPRQKGRPTLKIPELSNSTELLVMSPRWGSTPRLTDRLTVGRNVTLTQKGKKRSGLMVPREGRARALIGAVCTGVRGPAEISSRKSCE